MIFIEFIPKMPDNRRSREDRSIIDWDDDLT